MVIECMWIQLASSKSKPVEMHQELEPHEVDVWRHNIAQMFEAYGFPGAIVTMAYHNSPDGVHPIEPEDFKRPEPAPDVTDTPEPDPDTLPQYRKFFHPRDLFKK